MAAADILLILACAAAAGALGLLLGRSTRGRIPELSELKNAVSQTEGQIRQFSEEQERRWKTFDESVGRQSSEANKTMGALRERIGQLLEAHRKLEKLDSHVVDLQNLLSNKQAAGAFGEVQLENIVRQALPPAAYEFQKTLSNGRRADCVAKLPHPPGPISIDSKFPIASYRNYLDAQTGAERAAAAKAMAQAVNGHAKDIAERYIIPGETSEWAAMFLPSEALFAELHANFPSVIDRALGLRVGIVSPSTLMALLNTIRGVLRDADFRANADLIQKELGTLLEDVDRLSKRVGNLKRHFDQAQEDVREIDISSDKIGRRAGRIREVELDEADGPPRIAQGEEA